MSQTERTGPGMASQAGSEVMSATGTILTRRPRKPGQAASVFAQLPFVLQATADQRRQWYETIRDTRLAVQQRRERVLAHPDIAARLIRCGYSEPRNWNGYVPPATGDKLGPDGTMTARNDSPIRAELIEILRLVAQREAGG